MPRKPKRIIIKKENDFYLIENNEYFSNTLNISFDIYRKISNAVYNYDGLNIHLSPKFQSILFKIEEQFLNNDLKFEKWELEALFDWLDCVCVILLKAPEEWELILDEGENKENYSAFLQNCEEFIKETKKILKKNEQQTKLN